VDIRSDLYSLGCTLYFLLTGQAPFAAATTVIDKLLAHTEEAATPVQTLRPEVPDGLAEVVARLMSKAPEERYQTPAEVAAALTPFCKPGDPAATPVAAPVMIPVVDAVVVPPSPPNPFAMTQLAADTEPERVPNGPTLAEAARPRKSRKKKRPPDRRVWKWAVIAGIAVVVLLTGVVVRQVVKRVGTPTETVEKNDNPTGGPVTPPSGEKAGVIPPVSGGGSGRNPRSDTPPQVLFVLPSVGVWVPDYLPVREVLERDDRTKVVTASTRRTAAPTKEFADSTGPIPVDVVLPTDPDVTRYAAVVFCGQNAVEYITGAGAASAKALIRKMTEAGKPVAAICRGQAVLAQHGALAGKRVAANQMTRNFFPNATTLWVNKGVEADGKLVTAANPENAAEFAETLLDVIHAK
jgi:serine/threonine-protein kinase